MAIYAPVPKDMPDDEWWLAVMSQTASPTHDEREDEAIAAATIRLYQNLDLPIERLQVLIADGPLMAAATVAALNSLAFGAVSSPRQWATADYDELADNRLPALSPGLASLPLRQLVESFAAALAICGVERPRDASMYEGFFTAGRRVMSMPAAIKLPRGAYSMVVPVLRSGRGPGDIFGDPPSSSRAVTNDLSFRTVWRMMDGIMYATRRLFNTVMNPSTSARGGTFTAKLMTSYRGPLASWPERLSRLADVASLSAESFLLNDVAIVMRRPVALPTVIPGIGFHSTPDGSRPLEWRDGSRLMFWNGVPLSPQRWKWLSPEYAASVCGQSAFAWGRYLSEVIGSNQSMMAVFAERLGYDTLLRNLGAKEVHRDEYGILYRADIGAFDGALQMVEVENRTPGPDGSRTKYYLPVGMVDEYGEDIKTAHHAVASTYGLMPEEYNPTFAS